MAALPRPPRPRAADREDGIAHRFELEPPDVGAPEQLVERIDLRIARIVTAALLPGGRQQNLAMQLLE